jgi:hypothetical protein
LAVRGQATVTSCTPTMPPLGLKFDFNKTAPTAILTLVGFPLIRARLLRRLKS